MVPLAWVHPVLGGARSPYRVLAQRQELEQLGGRQLGQPPLAGANEHRPALSCARSVVDSLLQRAGADELVHLDERVWPMRKARSVAWSSTAGFHQRSKWNTWLAAVRLRPVPPAFKERMNSAGPRRLWKRATISSRFFSGVPPCRKSTSWPKVSAAGAQQIAHLGELREDQGPLPVGQHLLHHLAQPGQFPERCSGPSAPGSVAGLPSARKWAG